MWQKRSHFQEHREIKRNMWPLSLDWEHLVSTHMYTLWLDEHNITITGIRHCPLSLSPSVFPSLHPSTHPSLYLLVCLSADLSVFLCQSLLSVCLSTYLSVCLPICLPVCLSISLPTSLPACLPLSAWQPVCQSPSSPACLPFLLVQQSVSQKFVAQFVPVLVQISQSTMLILYYD